MLYDKLYIISKKVPKIVLKNKSSLKKFRIIKNKGLSGFLSEFIKFTQTDRMLFDVHNDKFLNFM